jgi:hypothetical protein
LPVGEGAGELVVIESIWLVAVQPSLPGIFEFYQFVLDHVLGY